MGSAYRRLAPRDCSLNSPPEVQIKDGGCNWLPFRVVCYGKCHGEKTGFKWVPPLNASRIVLTAKDTLHVPTLGRTHHCAGIHGSD